MAANVVGLDIGSSGVRAAEVSAGRTPTLVRAGVVPLGSGAVESGVVRNPRAVTDAIRTLWHEQHIKTKDVRLGIGSGSVLVRQLELDWMPPADLKKALRFQVADLLPVSVDDANLDHVLLDEYERTDPELGHTRRLVRILLVATARGAVDEMVRCVQAAGLRPRVADLSAFGLVRAAARAGSLNPGLARGTEAVIDIGADTVAVAVHTAGRPHFVRVIGGLGGSMLTRLLVERTGRSWEEAEATKRACTLPLPALAAAGRVGAAEDPHAQARHLAQDDVAAHVLLEGARQLVGEFQATLDFHANTDQEHPPERILLTGGGAALAGLTELTRLSLELPTRRFEPADLMPKLVPRRGGRHPIADDPAMVVPIGLALGASS
jgi:type IV pilus assembly protein PilM